MACGMDVSHQKTEVLDGNHIFAVLATFSNLKQYLDIKETIMSLLSLNNLLAIFV